MSELDSSRLEIRSKRLRLISHGPSDLLALIRGVHDYNESFGHPAADGLRDFLISGEVSPEWIAGLKKAQSADPWVHGFAVLDPVSGAVIGLAGFKGPPGTDGVVEIGYGIVPEFRTKGYATEAAEALSKHAFDDSRVRLVRAHTMPQPNASTRVLAKCGFEYRGEALDPAEGVVWRWEKTGGSRGEGAPTRIP